MPGPIYTVVAFGEHSLLKPIQFLESRAFRPPKVCISYSGKSIWQCWTRDSLFNSFRILLPIVWVLPNTHIYLYVTLFVLWTFFIVHVSHRYYLFLPEWRCIHRFFSKYFEVWVSVLWSRDRWVEYFILEISFLTHGGYCHYNRQCWTILVHWLYPKWMTQ